MFVSIYYKPTLFSAHTVILIVHIFMNVNKLCLNQMTDSPITLRIQMSRSVRIRSNPPTTKKKKKSPTLKRWLH